MTAAGVASPGEFVGERMHPVARRPRAYEYRTTSGEVSWDDAVVMVHAADDPLPPDGDGWEMCGSGVGELYRSRQALFWFWKRPAADKR